MSDSEQAAVRGPGEVALLEVRPGVAVVLGEELPEGCEIGLDGSGKIEPFRLGEVSRFGMGERADRDIANALSNAVSGANVLAQGAQSLVAVQGLVRLAPETIKNLNTMQTMVKDGYNLGVLTQGGKVAAHVRWVPATSAQAAAVLGGLGPSVALLAISAQLTSISRKVDTNIKLTHNILEVLYEGRWNELRGMYETILKAIDDARRVGVVTQRIYRRVEGLESELRDKRNSFNGDVGDHFTALKNSDSTSRRDYLRKNEERILGDIQGLIVAENAYWGFVMLQAAEIVADETRSAEDEETMKLLVEQIESERPAAMEKIAEILEGLDAQIHLAEKTSGNGRSPRHILSRNSRGLEDTVGGMISYVSQLRGVDYEPPLEVQPHICLIDGAPTTKEGMFESKVLDILRWWLPRDTPLLAIAEVRQGWAPGATSYLGVTHEHFFLTSSSALMKDGKIDHFCSLSDIRYVRYRTQKKKGASLDIVTKDKDISVTLAAGAEDPWDDAGRRLADLLMASANLPEEERRSVPPELEGIVSRRQLLPRGEAPVGASR